MGAEIKPLDDDLYLGSDVWLRWNARSDGDVDSALIIHKLSPGQYCWGSISLKNDPDGGTRHTWELESDFDFPTLSPSVLCHCGFHGFVKEGKWEPC